MKRTLTTVLALAALATSAGAMTPTFTNNMVSTHYLGSSQGVVSTSATFVLNDQTNKVDYLAAQVVISSNTPATITFTDGAKSTATVTVANNNALTSTSCTDFYTITSTVGIQAADLNVNGNHYLNGSQWSVGTTTNTTAAAIIAAINASAYGITAGNTGNTNTVNLQTVSSGTFCNAFTLSSNVSSITVNNAAFSGGRDNAALTINGVTLVQGTSWNKGASAAATATNIQNAINTNAGLTPIIISTAPLASAVLYATSTALSAGTNYPIYSNTAALTVSSNTFLNGSASSINLTSNLLSLPNHGYSTGLQVLLSTPLAGQGTLPTPLVGGTTYFAVAPMFTGAVTPDNNNLQLATTLANAIAQPPVVVTLTAQTAAGGGTFKLAPLAISGVAVLGWQASNDGINWSTLLLPNNVTVTGMNFVTPGVATSTYWDFGNVNARQIRANFAGPTAGQLNLAVTLYGKSAP